MERIIFMELKIQKNTGTSVKHTKRKLFKLWFHWFSMVTYNQKGGKI